ncbi:unnamed protein product [Amoebophrya sp. A25]|nr:unnamed protein product [Amoebophrya sp. A25]|eukprot:GSA25T00012983001.1
MMEGCYPNGDGDERTCSSGSLGCAPASSSTSSRMLDQRRSNNVVLTRRRGGEESIVEPAAVATGGHDDSKEQMKNNGTTAGRAGGEERNEDIKRAGSIPTSSGKRRHMLTAAFLFFSTALFAHAQTMVQDLSLKFPITHHGLDANWQLAGTTNPAADDKSIFLGVGVPGRVGYLWSKTPSPTSDVEIAFKFSVNAGQNVAHKQGWGFWFVSDQDSLDPSVMSILSDAVYMRTNTLGMSLNKANRDVFAYKQKWNGLGVLFTPRTVDYVNNPAGGGQIPSAKYEEAVVAAMNDGTRSLYSNGDIASALGTKVNYRTVSPVPGASRLGDMTGVKVMQLRIRGTATSTKVEIQDMANPGSWTKLLEENRPLPKGARIGFTSFIDDEAVDYQGGRREFDTIRLWDLEVKNYDSSVQIVNKQIQADKKGEDMHGDFLYEHGAQKEHREESAAIHQLTNMVMKLIAETEPVRREMEKTVNSLSARVINLERIFNELKAEINQKTGHDLDKEFEEIKHELVQLSQVASTETEKRKEKMAALHEDLESMKENTMGGALEKLTETNNAVLESLSSGHRWSFVISLCAIGIIIMAGFALYQRFRNWEKKHIL